MLDHLGCGLIKGPTGVDDLRFTIDLLTRGGGPGSLPEGFAGIGVKLAVAYGITHPERELQSAAQAAPHVPPRRDQRWLVVDEEEKVALQRLAVAAREDPQTPRHDVPSLNALITALAFAAIGDIGSRYADDP